jgi:hypothetical protein
MCPPASEVDAHDWTGLVAVQKAKGHSFLGWFGEARPERNTASSFHLWVWQKVGVGWRWFVLSCFISRSLPAWSMPEEYQHGLRSSSRRRPLNWKISIWLIAWSSRNLGIFVPKLLPQLKGHQSDPASEARAGCDFASHCSAQSMPRLGFWAYLSIREHTQVGQWTGSSWQKDTKVVNPAKWWLFSICLVAGACISMHLSIACRTFRLLLVQVGDWTEPGFGAIR